MSFILKQLTPRGTPSILDPCAGEGDALFQVAKELEAQAWGIEIFRERAKKAAAKGLRVYHRDAFTFRGKGFSLLWLNPPTTMGKGKGWNSPFSATGPRP